MKETGTTHWLTPNTGATNSSEFAGLPGGFRYTNGAPVIFDQLGKYAGFWSSTEFGTSGVQARFLYNTSTTLGSFIYFWTNGFSVRCVKD